MRTINRPKPNQKAQRLTKREKWQRYEKFKQELQRCMLSSTEYEREIRRYCDKHRL